MITAGDCPRTADGSLHRRSAKFAAAFEVTIDLAYLSARTLVDAEHAGNATRKLPYHLRSPREAM
jgi:hypothetical protein